MDRKARREHLEGLLTELQEQRKVDVDQVLMGLIHFVFQLDDELRNLSAQLAQRDRPD